MSKLKHVEMIRQRILKGQVRELTLLRGYISLTDGNQSAVDRLHGETGNLILAKITDLVLKELGHETITPVEEKASHIRREISRVRGKVRDEATSE